MFFLSGDRGGACRPAAPPRPGPPGGRSRRGPAPARLPRGTGARRAPAAPGRRGHISTLPQPFFNQHRSMTDNPARLVVEGVEKSLSIVMTWHAWDGRPIAGTLEGRPNVWTPAKALRRITDHLIDHLHEVHALLAAAEAVPDQWHGRLVTLDSDCARLTEPDVV